MAATRLKFLDSDEEERIHCRSLEVLSDVGVLVRSEHVLSMLGDSGAIIDRKKRIARLPESLVTEALRKAPNEFTLCAREDVNDIELPSDGVPRMTTDGLTLYMRDMDTGENRNATGEDYASFARLADALEAVDFFWPIVTISDVPQECHSAYELWIAFENCSMHVQGDCTSAKDARKQIELASLVVGGEDELKKRPIFSSAANPISPLSFDEGAVEAQVELSRAGIPILCHSMSMSGMSSLVTVAGTILNVNVENLASIVISQSASPGAPHIYGSSSAPTDMRTGGIDYAASEGLMISAGAAQMARRYGRPCMVANWGTGRSGPGMSSSFSEIFAYVGTVLSGSDLVSGVGGLDSAKGCSMGQMVLDSFIWDNFRSFLRTFGVDDLTMPIEVMRDVGQGGCYLSHPHTTKNFRRELLAWDRRKLAMEATLSDGMIPEAESVARTLLKEHRVKSLDEDVASEGSQVLRDYAKTISKSQ